MAVDLNHLRQFINERFKPEAVFRALAPASAPAPASAAPQGLEQALAALDESFSQYLLKLIDTRGMKDADVYRRAGIDRRHFSKIRTGRGYNPGKTTAVALGLAMRLDFAGLQALLSKAGYTLSHSSKFDLIIEYFITQGVYDLTQINEALLAFDQPLLGA